MTIKLEGRLKAVADNVPECDAVADIGTDHAFIPIYLVSQGICKRAIATDLRKGPLSAAKRNISEYGMTEVIETRIGGGLAPIADNEAETLIIAGMGGMLISEILGEDREKALKFKNIILQPMYAAEYLREWLGLNGFEIYNEDLAEEGRKLYNILDARPVSRLSEANYLDNVVGKALIAKNHPLLKKHIQKQIKIYSKIKEGLSKAKNDAKKSETELRKTNEILQYLKSLAETI